MAKLSAGVVRELPDFIEKEILRSKCVTIWEDLTPIQRNEFIAWIVLAKKEETKQKRLKRMIEDLQNGKKTPCCFPGDPLRRESAKKWFKNAK